MDFEYATALFKESTIEGFVTYFQNVLSAFLAQEDIRIADIDVMTTLERNKVLAGFNDTDADYEAHKTIVDLFTEQVNRTPDNTALRFGKETMTYKELDERSNKIAHYLIDIAGVEVGDLVGMMMDREMEYLTTRLG